MRRRPNLDVNQQEIVKRLRQCGVSCEPRLARLGDGIPDLLCGYRGRNFLFEVKRADLGPARQQLNADETEWHGRWAGQVHVITTWEDAMRIMLDALQAAP